MTISVCVATYNGEKYLKMQLDSILSQLELEDEIVICDDGSTDSTFAILENYFDPRLRVFRNEVRLGHVANFEKALSLASGDYIFLSDQDDIWIDGRVTLMMNAIADSPDVLLLATNFNLIDENGKFTNAFRSLPSVKGNRLSQVISIFIGRMPYYGCTFLLRKAFLKYCLPIPKDIESHDIWMALVASSFGVVCNISDPTLLHRIHCSNLTVKKRRSLQIIIISRLLFAKSLILRLLLLSFKIKRI